MWFNAGPRNFVDIQKNESLGLTYQRREAQSSTIVRREGRAGADMKIVAIPHRKEDGVTLCRQARQRFATE